MLDRTSNGKPMRILNIIDEFSRECLTIRVDRMLSSYDVIEQLAELFVDAATHMDSLGEKFLENVEVWHRLPGASPLRRGYRQTGPGGLPLALRLSEG